MERLAGGADTIRERILFGPVAPQWCSEAMLARIGDVVRLGARGAHLHLLESAAQRTYLDASLGRSVVDVLADLGLIGPTVSFAHGVWLSAAEMDRVRDAGSPIVINASCNLRLGNGIGPIGELLDRGVSIAFGTDDMTLDDDDDLFREVRLAVALARTQGHWLDAAAALSGATLGGARAALFDDVTGSIDPGKRADLVLLDATRLMEPYAQASVSTLDLVVARASVRDVRTVMIDGEVVLDDGRHRSIDRERLVEALKGVGRAQADDPIRQSAQALATNLARARGRWHGAPPADRPRN